MHVKTAHGQMNKEMEWRWTFWWVFKAHVFKGVFHQVNFSDLTNVFVSVIAIPLNLVIRVSFAFLALKVTELLWLNLLPFWMAHGMRQISDGSLFT